MKGSSSDDFRAHPNINYKKVKGFSSDDFRAHHVINYQKMKGFGSDDIRTHPDIKSQNRNNERFPHNTKRKIKEIRFISWILVMYMMITISNGNEILESDNDEFENQFQASPPVNAEPLFQLTPESTLKTVKQNNTTLQLQTWSAAPHVMIIQNTNTPSYQIINSIIDIGELAVMMKNSLKYLQHHNHLSHYIDTHIYGPKRFFSKNGVSNEEFMVLPGKTSKDNCIFSCTILNASLPNSFMQIKTGSEVLNTEHYFWMKTKQKTTKSSTYVFSYVLKLGNIEIFPKNETEDIKPCMVFLNKTEIEISNIKYHYQWYHDGVYHTTNGKRLSVSIDKKGNCKVIVELKTHESSHEEDDQHCMCVRPRTWWNDFEKNEMEAHELAIDAYGITEKMGVEPWRYKIGSNPNSISLDPTPKQGELLPRYIKISKEASRFENRYLTFDDISPLKIEPHNPTPLKQKDMVQLILKGMAKTAMSNPKLIKQFHSTMKKMLAKSPLTTFLPTKQIIGSDTTFSEKLNKLFKDYKITKENNVISVRNEHACTKCNWTALEKSKTGRDATIGLAQARRNVLFTKFFHKQILPKIIQNFLIPRHMVENVNIVFEEESIITYHTHLSYIALKVFLPIRERTARRILSISPLPFRYDSEENEYILKQVPSVLSLNEKEQPTDLGPHTPCALELIKPARSTQQCPNTSKKYKPINVLLEVEDYKIYLIANLGTISITCPSTNTHWYELGAQVNVLMMSTSCHLDTRGTKYSLSIKPEKTTPPKSVSAALLLSYNVHEDWTPSQSTQWIVMLSIAGVVTLLLIGTMIGVSLLIKFKPYPIDLSTYLNKNQVQEGKPKSPPAGRSFLAMSNLNEPSSSEEEQHFNPSNFDKPIHKYKYGQKSMITDIPLSAEPVCLKRTYFEPPDLYKTSPQMGKAPLANREVDTIENCQTPV